MVIEDDHVTLCDDCVQRWRSRGTISYWLPTEEVSPPPAEERFDELFRAARMLLEIRAEEDQIIPTLALANEIGQEVSHLVAARARFVKIGGDGEAWNNEANKFVRRYGSLRPVRVVDGMLILERLPVSVTVENDPDDEVLHEVTISVYAHRRLAKPDHVASLYEKTLRAAGLPHDEQRTGHLGFDFHNRSLRITIRNGSIAERLDRPRPTFRIDKAPFPHPRIVQEFYRMLLGSPSGDGFARHLAIRTRGGPPAAEHLVPACVAFYLRAYGEIRSRKEIHRLLNEHVLRESGKQLPEEAHGSSETNQLWRDVNNHAKIGNPLMDAGYTLFWEGEE
jgi:hypothetical protein